ncbi:hypothetical protein [Clostridium estertheticum]|nr:hypothetical protein [Clostridium estertheticum]
MNIRPVNGDTILQYAVINAEVVSSQVGDYFKIKLIGNNLWKY